jgi:hypothetical protein
MSTVGATPSAVAIQVSQPQLFRVVEFILQRIVLPPDVPDAALAENDEVVVEKDFQPMQRAEDAKGTPVFTIRGRIVFRRLNGQASPKYPEGGVYVKQGDVSATIG